MNRCQGEHPLGLHFNHLRTVAKANKLFVTEEQHQLVPTPHGVRIHVIWTLHLRSTLWDAGFTIPFAVLQVLRHLGSISCFETRTTAAKVIETLLPLPFLQLRNGLRMGIFVLFLSPIMME